MKKHLFMALVLSGLGACAAQPPFQQSSELSRQGVEGSAGSSRESALATAPGATLSFDQIQQLLLLLDQAELAMKARRLTSPAGNNALQAYREVLAVLPEHEEATAGVRKIADSYIDWSYAALRQGQLQSAKNYYQRAKMTLLEHPALAALAALIAETEQQQAQQTAAAAVVKPVTVKPTPVAAPSKPVEVATAGAKPQGPAASQTAPVALVAVPVTDAAASDFTIDRGQLRRRSDALQAQLAGYADLIMARNSRVTIEAPSDADGRWLYQRLNDRREAYRIRANFKISQQPRIRLLD